MEPSIIALLADGGPTTVIAIMLWRLNEKIDHLTGDLKSVVGEYIKGKRK